MGWLIAFAAGLGLLMFSGKKEEGALGGPAPSAPPVEIPPAGATADQWHAATAAAIATNLPGPMRSTAAALQAAGYQAAAADLNARADTLSAAAVPTPAPAQLPPAATAPVTVASSGPPSSSVELAAALASHVRFKEGAAVRGQVAAYQVAHGLKADGLYGAGTAEALAAEGVIPPAPYYWPAANTAKAVSDYRNFLLARMGTDPARAAQWATAASNAGK